MSPGTVRILYTNHRGETAWRTIQPKALRYAATEHYPTPQWILDAYDVEKQADRSFACANAKQWEGYWPIFLAHAPRHRAATLRVGSGRYVLAMAVAIADALRALLRGRGVE
jgi:hypothetical protein